MLGNRFGKYFQEISAEARANIDEILYPCVGRPIHLADTILDTDPSFGESDLFQVLTKGIVYFLEAQIAGIWVFESTWKQVASFHCRENVLGVCRSDDLFERSIVQEIVGARESFVIADIWNEDRWRNKQALREKELRLPGDEQHYRAVGKTRVL